MTTAERIAQVWNASRNTDLTADLAFENVLNASFGKSSSLSPVAEVNIYQREIRYADGSYLWVLDVTASRAAGISEYNYSFKAQDKAC